MAPEELETDRLLLRPFTMADLSELSLLHAEPSFWWFPLRRGQSEEETAAFLERVVAGYEPDGVGLCAVVRKEDGVMAGWAGLNVPTFLPEVLPAVEVGWRFGERFRGQGYAVEAGAAALGYGFDPLGLDRILSIFEPENVSSGRVMDKLGFLHDRHTTHPVLAVPLEVRVLERRRWRPGT
ncbi:MAG TPA: GNAT family N-acetyltransferase [Acidimicrobiales bacterium]|nr:GNAT family N-acetyltransferase [Acidimicrobiales bacterium]